MRLAPRCHLNLSLAPCSFRFSLLIMPLFKYDVRGFFSSCAAEVKALCDKFKAHMHMGDQSLVSHMASMLPGTKEAAAGQGEQLRGFLFFDPNSFDPACYRFCILYYRYCHCSGNREKWKPEGWLEQREQSWRMRLPFAPLSIALFLSTSALSFRFSPPSL